MNRQPDGSLAPLDLNRPVGDLARRDPVALLDTETVAEALVRLRGEELGERILYFYAVGADGRLLGVVPTRRLLLSQPSAHIAEAMARPVVAVGESEPLSSAVRILTEKRLLALPVVDDGGRLSGLLDLSTVTRTLFDLERKEAADEIFQIAGLHLERASGGTAQWALRNRFPWLLMNIASGLAAALISEVFDGTLKSVVAIAFFIPLVLTLAESVAMQTVTISLQSLHLARRVPGQGGITVEVRTGLLLGGLCAAIVAALGYGWLGLPRLAVVVAFAIVAASTMGTVFGYAVPRLVHRLRLDPKIASGPAVLALTDITALACYLALAAAVLGG